MALVHSRVERVVYSVTRNEWAEMLDNRDTSKQTSSFLVHLQGGLNRAVCLNDEKRLNHRFVVIGGLLKDKLEDILFKKGNADQERKR